MWFKICDQILATEEEREAIYKKLEDHGYMIDERDEYDEEEYVTFTWKYIDIYSLKHLMRLNEVLGHPVVINGNELDFLEHL